jgi:hypothetical protein
MANKKKRKHSYDPLQLFAHKDKDSTPTKVNNLHDNYRSDISWKEGPKNRVSYNAVHRN